MYFDDTHVVGRIAKVNGTVVTPLVTVQKEYTGIWENNFNDREDFVATCNAVIAEMAAGVTKVPSTLYIGIANQFCQVETLSSELEFDRLTKINRHHLQVLWDDMTFNTEHREIISERALYFKLEEYEDVLLDVLGVTTAGVTMVASAISISNELRPLFDVAAMQQAGFTDCQLVCLAECELFMIPEKSRDAGCTLVRSDFFSTSIANVLGDGLTQLSHFNLGMGHLVGEIVDNFGIEYQDAMALLLHSTPTYEMLLEETYTANGQTVPAGIFNEFVMKRITEFGNRLSNVEMARVIYLSGGNYDQIYGVPNVLSNLCERRLDRCQDVLTGLTTYPENTLNALLRYAVRQ